jgi:hypothetical protein
MQRLTNFWCSSVDLPNVEAILYFSPSVLQHHWCNRLTSCSLFGDAARPHLAPSFGTTSLLCTPRERNLKGMDWEKGSYRMASQVTRFDPCRFLSMGVHKRLGVPNEGARCGRTASLNNCSLWECYTSDAVKHLARGGVSSRHLSGHQGRTRGDVLRNPKS